MKRLVLALTAMLLALGATAPPASATTVTLYYWYSGGWSGGWANHAEGPSYGPIYVTWTYRGTTGCNSGSDWFEVRIVGHDPYDGSSMVVRADGEYGPEYNSSFTRTFEVTSADYGFSYTKGYRVDRYVGPQAACSASVRVWEYA